MFLIANGPYWIGYDDPESALIKSKYANAMGLRGTFIWSLDTCDFNGEYNDDGATYPILRAMWEGLESGETFMPDRDCVGTAANCDPSKPPCLRRIPYMAFFKQVANLTDRGFAPF